MITRAQATTFGDYGILTDAHWANLAEEFGLYSEYPFTDRSHFQGAGLSVQKSRRPGRKQTNFGGGLGEREANAEPPPAGPQSAMPT